MGKMAGKIAVALAVFFGLNIIISIPIGIIAGIMAAMQSIELIETDHVLITSEHLTAEHLMEFITVNPLLRTSAYTLSAAAGAAAAAIMYLGFERDRSWPLGWKQRRWLPNALLGLLLGALLISLCFLGVFMLGGVRLGDAQWNASIATAIGLDIILFSAVAIGEELFARGYIYGVAKKQKGILFAVVLSSLLFALLHSMNPGVFSGVFPMLNLFLAGVMLALFREWSGGLWVPIGVHMTWNYFQGDIFGMAVSGTSTPSIFKPEIVNLAVAGGGFGLEGSFVTTIVMIAVSALLTLSIRKKQIRTPDGVL